MKFTSEIKIIGINPFVSVPDKILQGIFKKAGKDKGTIPIKGTLNNIPYKQTLVKYSGAWRLYINTRMLKNSPKRVGEVIKLSVEYDPEPRVFIPHPKFINALKQNSSAKTIFDNLSPSRQMEIVRYLANLKTEETLERNINKVVSFLLGKERFAGRDKP